MVCSRSHAVSGESLQVSDRKVSTKDIPDSFRNCEGDLFYKYTHLGNKSQIVHSMLLYWQLFDFICNRRHWRPPMVFEQERLEVSLLFKGKHRRMPRQHENLQWHKSATINAAPKVSGFHLFALVGRQVKGENPIKRCFRVSCGRALSRKGDIL